MDPLRLPRIQFAANISFHILFLTISIALGWALRCFKLQHNRWARSHGLRFTADTPWLAALLLFFIVDRSLRRLPTRLAQGNAYGDWVLLAGAAGIVMLAFYGLAYSLFPWLVVDRLTVWQAAGSVESLWIIFLGACVVLPIIMSCTVFSCRVFGGKATALQY